MPGDENETPTQTEMWEEEKQDALLGNMIEEQGEDEEEDEQ